MATLIRETPFHKVWMAKEGEAFGMPFNPEWDGIAYKYLVVDTYHGGVTALRTNNGLEARMFEVVRTPYEIMRDILEALIKEFSIKNIDFNRKKIITTEIYNWNKYAKQFDRPEFVITETFSRRQSLANKFAEILEAL